MNVLIYSLTRTIMKKFPLLFLLIVCGSLIGGSFKFNKCWKKTTKRSLQEISRGFPIVFHPKYDIGFMGIENLHPFDAKKYGKVYRYLQATVFDKVAVYTPEEVTDPELLRVHTQRYLSDLKNNTSSVLASITEIGPLSFLPNFLTRRYVLKPMRLATKGTVLASRLALKHGMAVNLSGGYHHAKSDSGGGFCALADIPLAAYDLLDEGKVKKVMVIDLDAHQGNGHEAIFASDSQIAIFDVYNAWNYPRDIPAQQHITFNHPVKPGIKDEEYLSLIRRYLPEAIKKANPDFIIYNAGTDVYERDPLGGMSITKEGIIERDHIVFEEATKRSIPIVMVLSGGYTKESASIIGASLENIINNFIVSLK